MKKKLEKLLAQNYLKEVQHLGKSQWRLTTPCRFRILSNVIESVKKNYIYDGEIGGLLWAKPANRLGEVIYVIENVTYLRNAIEDTPRADGLNRKNAYMFDAREFSVESLNVYSNGCFPIRFHTHPTQGRVPLESFMHAYLQMETSEADRLESARLDLIGAKEILLPRILIVGNEISKSDLFIGIYGGGISPVGFEEAKREVQYENFDNLAKSLSSFKKPSPVAIVFMILACLGLIYLMIKYPKACLSAIVTTILLIPHMATNTSKQVDPKYFNKHIQGDAEIFLPEYDEIKEREEVAA